LPDELYLLTNLQSLSLGMNELEATISSQVTQLQQLESLWLGFTPEGGTIPTELGVLSNMKVLGRNKKIISLALPLLQSVRLADLLCLFPFFLALAFTNGSVKGKVPTEIGLLSNLEYFALGSCPELVGTMPTFNFPSAKFFSITECGFTGKLDAGFCWSLLQKCLW
jgi:Leucine-rich repeat (LRR) protein